MLEMVCYGLEHLPNIATASVLLAQGVENRQGIRWKARRKPARWLAFTLASKVCVEILAQPCSGEARESWGRFRAGRTSRRRGASNMVKQLDHVFGVVQDLAASRHLELAQVLALALLCFDRTDYVVLQRSHVKAIVSSPSTDCSDSSRY